MPRYPEFPEELEPESVTLTQLGADALRSREHNHNCFQGNATLVTSGIYQYAIYITDDGSVMVGQSVAGGAWVVVDTGFTNMDLTDPHYAPNLGVDPDGYIHINIGGHNTPMANLYSRSTNPHDIAAWNALAGMTGVNENQVTYVRWFNNANNLFCIYRNGTHTNGSIFLNRYDHAITTWAAVHHPLINPIGAGRHPYTSVAVDSAGRFHLAWTWRHATIAEVNENICYAISADAGATWQESDGTGYALPITFAASEIVDASGVNDALWNDPMIDTDSLNRPHITYLRNDGANYNNIFHLWFDGANWARNQITELRHLYSYASPPLKHNPRPTIVCLDATVFVFFSFPVAGGQIRAAVATYPYTDWVFHRLGADAWYSVEMSIDITNLRTNRTFMMLISRPDRNGGATPIYVLETGPQTWKYAHSSGKFQQEALTWGAGYLRFPAVTIDRVLSSHRDRTYYIDYTNGSDGYDGLTAATAWRTWQRALRDIPHFIRNIYVIRFVGNYTGALFLPNRVICRGDTFTTGRLTIVGDTGVAANHVFSGGLLIDCVRSQWGRLHVQHLSFSSYSEVGATQGVTIQECSLQAAGGIGIRVAAGSGISILTSVFGVDVCQDCIDVRESSQLYTNTNTGNGTRYGIYASRCALVGKQGAQPTGTIANEFTELGAQIW